MFDTVPTTVKLPVKSLARLREVLQVSLHRAGTSLLTTEEHRNDLSIKVRIAGKWFDATVESTAIENDRVTLAFLYASEMDSNNRFYLCVRASHDAEPGQFMIDQKCLPIPVNSMLTFTQLAVAFAPPGEVEQ